MHFLVAGMGSMGTALAARLLETGNRVDVWNRTSGRADEAVRLGAMEIDSADQPREGTEAVVLSLANDTAVTEVAMPDGESVWPNLLVVDSSTVSPATTLLLDGVYGARFVSAPILGSPDAVRSGKATALVGGDQSAVQSLSHLWEAFGSTWATGDQPTTASVFKILNNHLLLASLASVAETVRIARAAGVDDTDLKELVRTSPFVPAGLANRIDSLFDPDHQGWFGTGLGAKDMSLALEMVQPAPELPVTEAVLESYRQVARCGWADADITAVVELGTGIRDSSAG